MKSDSQQQFSSFCISCGQTLTEADTFCPSCGATVEKPVKNSDKKNLKPIIIAIIAVVVALSVIGTAFFFLTDSFSGSPVGSKSSKKDKSNSGYDRLCDFIIENGTEADGAYHLMKDCGDDTVFIMTEDDGKITWALISNDVDSGTITNLNLEKNSKTQSVSIDMSFKDGTPGFSLYGDIKTAEFSLDNPEIYDFRITTSLLEESDCLPFFESTCQYLLSLAEETLEDSNISMADLGFTSY